MSSFIDILEALRSGATVLTANHRAARALQQQWDQQHIARGEHAWPAAAIHTWGNWCEQQWALLLDKGIEDRLLLTALQEYTLWQEIIAVDQKPNPRLSDSQRLIESLINPGSLAQTAQQANALLAQYCAEAAFAKSAGNQTVEAFRRWRRIYIEECQKNRLLSTAELEGVLAKAFDTKKLAAPKNKFVLVGFDRFTPAQIQLIDALQTAGCVCDVAKTTRSSESAWHSYPTSRDEAQAAALWAREILRQTSHARIAIILPSVDARRAEIDRVFRRILAPAELDITRGTHSLPYEFSLGQTIRQHPMTAAALEIFRWCIMPLPIDDAAALLRSPWFFSSAEDEQRRLKFELKTLRQSPSLLPEITLDDVFRLTHHGEYTGLFSNFEKLKRLLLPPKQARHSHTEWADIFHAALQVAGWPGSATLNSAEFQLFERWKHLLDDFSRMDYRSTTVDLQSALQKLRHAADQAHFAPESQNAPVQILGVLESAGNEFDAVWFAGATAESWPSPGDTQPLLPWYLQRDLKMPHAVPAAEFDLALTMQQRIMASAPVAIISNYRENSDGAVMPSPLLQSTNLPEQHLTNNQPSSLPPHEVATETANALGTLPPVPDGVVRGGAGVLKSQSLCPFRAFAEHRLHSTAPEEVGFGLDARSTGSIIHDVLHTFWEQTRSQQALLSLSVEERRSRLHAIATQQLTAIIQPSTAWEHKATEIQADALADLLMEWMVVEAKRPPFTVSATEESIKKARIGPIEINMRCDRIDEVNSGEVLIDYKTGDSKPSSWDGPRPEEPQLPLYAITRAQVDAPPLKAIAFAAIRAGEAEMRGIQSELNVLFAPTYNANRELTKRAGENKTADLSARIAEWTATLTILAENFHHGIPYVNPKDINKTCKYCQQKTLCRISELAMTEEEDEEEDEDDSN